MDWIEWRIEAACCAATGVCIVMYARIVMYAHDVTYERIPSTPFGAAGTAGDAAGTPPCGAPWSVRSRARCGDRCARGGRRRSGRGAAVEPSRREKCPLSDPGGPVVGGSCAAVSAGRSPYDPDRGRSGYVKVVSVPVTRDARDRAKRLVRVDLGLRGPVGAGSSRARHSRLRAIRASCPARSALPASLGRVDRVPRVFADQCSRVSW
jgi:hypothetical protein